MATTSATTCYYKVRQLSYCKLGPVLLQSVTVLLQSEAGVKKCDDYYKVRQLSYCKLRPVLLQSVTVLLQSEAGVKKCDDYYKVRQRVLLVIWGVISSFLYNHEWFRAFFSEYFYFLYVSDFR